MKVFTVALMMALILTGNVFAQSVTQSINSDGENRTYILHTPPGAQSGQKLPLMVVLHGRGGSAEGFEQTTGFDAVADHYGFMVVYPNAIGSKWKIGGRGGDVSFLQNLVGSLEQTYPIDASRIYVAGLSQGGGLAQALVCLTGDKIAGVAVVSENLNENFESRCRPTQPITYLLFHGTADPISPYNGGANGVSGASTYSAQQTVQFWVQNARCGGNAVITHFADHLKDGSAVSDTIQTWGSCANGTTVTFYTIQNGGHVWPGTNSTNERFGLGSVDLNASQIIWDTLSPHRLTAN